MTDNLKLIILNAAVLALDIIFIIILLILKHKEDKKNMNEELETNIGQIEPSGNDLINKDLIVSGSKAMPNTIYITADHFILKDKTLDIEIDLKGQLDNFDKIVINGVTFVREEKNND